MSRVLTFRVPPEQQQAPKPLLSDRSSTWPLLPQLAPTAVRPALPPSPKEELVLNVFGRGPDSLLMPPKHSLPPPFAFYTQFNGDALYMAEPRLLVTKLLVLSWCELREYYEVYAGLPRRVPTARLTQGTDYHRVLEERLHRAIDPLTVSARVEEILGEMPEERVLALTQGGSMAFKLAHQWVEQILVRCLAVAHTGYAREMHLHGFLDLTSGELATSKSTIGQGVLVNGIADMVRLEPDPYGDDRALQWDPQAVLELGPALEGAKARMDRLATNHTLEVRDVKTRAYNNVPKQSLVVEAARDQCMYYAQFLTTLAQDEEYAYQSLVENFTRRHIQTSHPLGEAHAAALLITNFGVLVEDYMALARGDALGFAPFDNATTFYVTEQPPEAYSLANFVDERTFRTLLADFHGDYFADVDISVLFRKWQRPLTPAYFCARAAQALHLFEKLKPSSVCVEYHNVKTGRIIECKSFPFDKPTLEEASKRAAQFWAGTRPPISTDDTERCKSCDFRSRCAAVNEQAMDKALVGDVIKDFLEL